MVQLGQKSQVFYDRARAVIPYEVNSKFLH